MADAGEHGYGRVARLFHWAIVVLVAIMIPVGVAMTSETLEPVADPLFILHKGLGVVVLVVVLARLVWRLTHPAPPMPDHVPPLERRVAGLTHWGLYVLLLVQPITGYVRTVADDFPIELLDALGVPPLLPQMPQVAGVALVIHQLTPYLLTALIAAHVTGVLRHALVEEDDVLERMWPPGGTRAQGGAGERTSDGPGAPGEAGRDYPGPRGSGDGPESLDRA